MNFNDFVLLSSEVLGMNLPESTLLELYNNPIDRSFENLMCELSEVKHISHDDRETGE